MENKISNNILKTSMKLIISVFSSVSIIAISTIMALNMTFIYKIMIYKYNLVEATGVNPERLMLNYKQLIKYLQNPFLKELKFQDFIMSNYGEVHFYEVKKIFITLIFIAVVFILGMSIYFFSTGKQYNNYKGKIIKSLNLSSNILILFFIIIFAAYIIDFSKAFTIFHKVFFRNNYWIFDPLTDPIINALPESLFMVYGGIILGVVGIFILLIKIIYRKALRY